MFHFGLMLWPRLLSFDWSMDAISPITEFKDIRNLATLFFYAILAAGFLLPGRKKRSALLLLAIPFIPATNLFAYVGFVAAERILYLPSVGFCLLVGMGAQFLLQRRKKTLVYLSLSILILSLGYRTIQRNRDWMDEERLYRSGIAINPPKGINKAGVVIKSVKLDGHSPFKNKSRRAITDSLRNRPSADEGVECSADFPK